VDQLRQGCERQSTAGLQYFRRQLGLLRPRRPFDNSNGLKDAVNNPASYLLAMARKGITGAAPDMTILLDRQPVTFHEDLIRAFGYAQPAISCWTGCLYPTVGGMSIQQNDKNDMTSGQCSPRQAPYTSRILQPAIQFRSQHQYEKDFSDELSGALLLGQNYFTLTNHSKISNGTGLTLPNFLDMANVQSYTAQEL